MNCNIKNIFGSVLALRKSLIFLNAFLHGRAGVRSKGLVWYENIIRFRLRACAVREFRLCRGKCPRYIRSPEVLSHEGGVGRVEFRALGGRYGLHAFGLERRFARSAQLDGRS